MDLRAKHTFISLRLSSRREPTVAAVSWAFMVALAVSLVVTQPAAAQGPDNAADPPEPISIVVVPDTQIYLDSNRAQPAGRDTFLAQFVWIAANIDTENIVFTTHVGDVVQNPSVQAEWDWADEGYDLLDAIDAPYGISPGNHDMEPGGISTIYDQMFGPDRYADRDWFGSTYGDRGTQNTWHTIETPGLDLLFIQTAHVDPTYGDPTPIYAALRQVLERHPHHLAVVTTHEFTRPDGSIGFPDFADALKGQCNVGIVFSGHRFGLANGTFTDDCGRSVPHVLTNFQGEANTVAEGWLRTVTIDPVTLDADLDVYSPLLQQIRAGADANLDITLAEPPAAPTVMRVDSACAAAGTDGVITVYLSNPGRGSAEVTATIDGRLSRTVSLAPGQDRQIQWAGRPDGLRTVEVTITGPAEPPAVIGTLATTTSTETRRVACDPEVGLAVSCLGGNGRIDIHLANRSGASAEYELTARVGTRTVALADLANGRITITGRPDGSEQLELARNGTTIWNDVALISCDPTVDVSCLVGNGLISVRLVNAATTATNFEVAVDGLSPRMLTVPAQTVVTTRFSGRPDGVVGVSTTATNQGVATIENTAVTVDCDPDPTGSTVSVSCLAGNGRIDVDLWNPTGVPVDYNVKVGGLDPRVRAVDARSAGRVTVTGRRDRALPVVVESVAADGSTALVLAETVTVACD